MTSVTKPAVNGSLSLPVGAFCRYALAIRAMDLPEAEAELALAAFPFQIYKASKSRTKPPSTEAMIHGVHVTHFGEPAPLSLIPPPVEGHEEYILKELEFIKAFRSECVRRGHRAEDQDTMLALHLLGELETAARYHTEIKRAAIRARRKELPA